MDIVHASQDAGSWWSADDSRLVRVQRSRIMGWLLICGSMLALLTMELPGWAAVPLWQALTLTGSCVVFGVALLVWAAHISAPWSYAVIAAAAIGAALNQQLLGVETSAAVAVTVIYVWPAVLVAVYYKRVPVAIVICLIGICQFAVLHSHPASVWLPQVGFTVGTCAIVAVVVGVLANRLRELTVTDPLTGIANRRAFEAIIAREVPIAAQRGQRLSVLLIDLDDFKQINDSRGHLAGDQALAGAVAAWNGCLRAGDTLARIGGDEFAAVLPGCDEHTALAIAERLVATTPEGLSCSIGVAPIRGHGDPTGLVTAADLAMYRAKSAGGARAVLAEP